jgi:hypothetical protein
MTPTIRSQKPEEIGRMMSGVEATVGTAPLAGARSPVEADGFARTTRVSGKLVSLATRWDELDTVQASGQLLLPL